MKPIDKFNDDILTPEELRLLEYVIEVADKFNPDVNFDNPDADQDDEDSYLFPSQAPYTFIRRYNSNSLHSKFEYQRYISNKGIQLFLKEQEVDIQKFWYLLLFVYDYVYGACTSGLGAYRSIYDELTDIAETVNTFGTKGMEIEIRVHKKKVLQINNPRAISYLAKICKEDVENTDRNSNKYSDSIKCCSAIDFENKINKNASIKICLLGNMFQYFFSVNPQFNFRKKRGEQSLSKLLLISRLVYFTGLTPNKVYNTEEGADTLKGLLSKYKGETSKTTNSIYL